MSFSCIIAVARTSNAMRSVQKVSSHVLRKRDIYWRLYKIQETLYVGQWCLSPLQSRHLGTSHSSSSCHQLPCHILLNVTDSLKSSLTKVILVFGKARNCRPPNLGSRVFESPGWFDISSKNSAQDVIHEWVRCHDEAANHQLPIAAGFWILQIVSVKECSRLTQNLMQICCSTLPVIFNVMATQYTCSLNSVYCPQWLVQ